MRLFSKTVAAFSLALLTAAGARADNDSCKEINTFISTTVQAVGCASPVGFCTTGTVLSGLLAGTTQFEALSGAYVAAGLSYTGQLVITTKHGSLTLSDAGILSPPTYSEIEKVVSGTGRFSGATGMLISSGVLTRTGFLGTLIGTVCFDKEHDRGEEHDDGGSEPE